MIAKIYVEGVVGEDVTLLDVVRQFKSYHNPESIEVHINSVGGSVDTGQAIFGFLRNAGIPVHTIAHQAYSIAATIFMAGDTREVPEGEDRVMIHMPFVQNATGNSSELDSLVKHLKSVESEFVKFYSTYTNVDEDTVRNLLENEQFLSASEAFELGLATVITIPFKAVAFFDKEDSEKLNINKNVIMKNADLLLSALKTFIQGKEGVVALVLQDANGVEVNFPDKGEGEVVEVGDKAEIDNKPAEGEVIMPDGSTLVFEAGLLSEIKPAEGEPEGEPEDEAIDPAAKEGEDKPEDEAETAAEDAVEPEVNIEDYLKELFNKAKDAAKEELNETIAGLSKQNEDMSAEVIALKKLIGSDDIEVGKKETNYGAAKFTKMERAVQILNARKRK